jgi:hypothetical protein
MTVRSERAPLAKRIATRTGCEEQFVNAIMAAHGIAAATAPVPARSLRIARLRVVGAKSQVPNAGPFDRTFTFPSGVVMAVAPNLSGKTSLLELITLCLRGSARDLQADVAAWVRVVECDVELNGMALGIRLDLDEGEIASGKVYQAMTLERLPEVINAGRALIGAHGAEYADRIEALMLDRFSLEPIHAVDKRAGLQQHGWPSYFGAIYPPAGGERVLIGETAMAGLAGRLLAVFLDLPRTAALTRIRTTAANQKSRAEEDRKRTVSPRTAQLRTAQEAALARARIALSAIGATHTPSATDVAELVADLSARLAAADRERRDLIRAHDQATADRQQDQRTLNTVREDFVAARLFHGLDPTSCPRCEAPVGSDRRIRENSDHVCAVCTAPLVGEEDQEAREELIAEREHALEASRAAEDAARAALDDASAEVAQIGTQLQEAEAALTAARAARETGERARLETDIARAEGALAVLSEAEQPMQPVEPDLTLVVLDALADELDKEMRESSADLLQELGEEIAQLARDFGIAAVSGVKVDLRAALRIEKGGAGPTAFSAQSPGERLRLRIATVVALLRVGARRGIATHPGLLMLDSLRAEEVQESDAHALLDALLQIAAETPGLQIITTTADETLPDGRLTEDHVFRPSISGGRLW